jgi:hypothetical protein
MNTFIKNHIVYDVIISSNALNETLPDIYMVKEKDCFVEFRSTNGSIYERKKDNIMRWDMIPNGKVYPVDMVRISL